MWLFPDRAYHNGIVYPVVNDIVKINDISFTFDKEIKKEIEVVYPHRELPDDKEHLAEVLTSFISLYNVYGYLGIGWIIATFMADVISTKKLAGQFPVLASYGLYQSGKTAYALLLSELAGIDTPLVTEVTKDIWRKDIHLFSCLPIMYDEVKETKGPKSPFVILRSYINKTFDRSTLKKGNISRYGSDRYDVHGTITLVGEVSTIDSAILSRLIQIDSTKFQKNKSLFKFVKQNMTTLNAIGQYFMRTSDDWKETFIESYQYFTNVMEERSIKNDRMEINYAIVLSGIKTFMQVIDQVVGRNVLYSDLEIENIIQYVAEHIKTNGQELKNFHPSMQFLQDIGTMVAEDDIHETAYKVFYNCEFNGKMYDKLLFLAPRSIWNSYQVKVHEPFYSSNNQLKKDLENYPFFLGTKSQRISSVLKSAPTCWVIDLSHPYLPPEILNFEPFDSLS